MALQPGDETGPEDQQQNDCDDGDDGYPAASRDLSKEKMAAEGDWQQLPRLSQYPAEHGHNAMVWSSRSG